MPTDTGLQTAPSDGNDTLVLFISKTAEFALKSDAKTASKFMHMAMALREAEKAAADGGGTTLTMVVARRLWWKDTNHGGGKKAVDGGGRMLTTVVVRRRRWTMVVLVGEWEPMIWGR